MHFSTNTEFILFFHYRSPQGRNYYEDHFVFSVNDITDMIHNIQASEIHRNIYADERSKLTPSLRYKILKRDQFRCCICGATVADGVKLHVDHILPVSKGGKTIESNLRTLCQHCNLGKSDSYDLAGIN